MIELDTFALPPDVLAHFSNLPDESFDSDADVIEAQEQLSTIRKQQQASASEHIKALKQIDELEARVEACKLEAQRINAQRIARIYAELQAGKDDFESDRHDLAEMERLNHCAAAITLVLPELRKQAQNISSRTRDIVSREEDAENRLQVVLNDRRLAEARRLANR